MDSSANSPGSTGPAPARSVRYLEPGFFTRRVFNPLVARLTRWGISLQGSWVLEVQGRSSGELRSTVVNMLTFEGQRYLVAPRGNAHWVRNLRAAGTATLRLGRQAEAVTATELEDAAKVPVIRAYLKRWAWEVGAFVEGLSADSSDEEIAAAAPGFPVFRLAAA